MKRTRNILRIVFICIFAAIFLISAYYLADYFMESYKQQNRFDELADIVQNAQPSAPSVPDETQDPSAPTQPPWVEVIDPETGEVLDILPEYAELYLMNNDLVGWITIPDTQINYPVMQTPDSVDYYLKRDFDKEYSSRGCLYAREECGIDPASDNITIYGHRMKDGSMFADIGKFTDKDFWETHKTFTFNTLKAHHTYEVLAVFMTTASVGEGFSYHLFVNAAGEHHFASYIDTCKELALYDTGVTAQYGDKLITLSTCDYYDTNGRLVLVAKRVS